MSVTIDPFASTNPEQPNPYENLSPHARAAYAEQNAAIAAMRAKQSAAHEPQIFLPFGRQQPLRKYVGMQVIPLRKNPWIDRPELILKQPEPGYHYGFSTYDARTKGLFRSHQYEPVYEHELLEDNDVPYSVEAVLAPPSTVLTERGPCNLVLWHGMVMIKIPPGVWLREYEMPALQSATRLSVHADNFRDGSIGTQSVVRSENDGVQEFTHSASETRIDRGSVKVAMRIGDGAQEQVDREIRTL